MDPQEHARRVEEEDAPLSPDRLAAFRDELERVRATQGFATGRNRSPEADARRSFLTELETDDV